MIARLWHGYTKPENANRYDKLLRTVILPGIHRIDGYRGAWLLRRLLDTGNEVEFITLTLWDSMDSVKEFAGDSGAVIHPEAQQLFTRYDAHSVHYEGTWCP
jgi:heme-degrading monooxygenase HmoA